MAHPRTRRGSRERALQYLFGLDFTGYAWDDGLNDFWAHFPSRESVKPYAEQLIRGVCEHQEQLDQQVLDALDKWTPDRVGRIERVILRIALYEMTYEADVPANVAINEAIEITKRFGSEESPRFINGVLDRARRMFEEKA